MVKPLTYRNPALRCSEDEGLDKIVQFASLLDEAEGSGSLGALSIDTFWIEKESVRRPLFEQSREPLTALLLRITNLREMVCNFAIPGPIFASSARLHGSTLEKLSIRFHGRDLPAALQSLKHLAALQDLRIRVHGDVEAPGSVEPFHLPCLRLLEIETSGETSDVLKWFAQSNLPIITKFVMNFPRARMDSIGLPAFMVKHGASLSSVRFGMSRESLSTVLADIVFPYALSLSVLDIDVSELQKLPKNLPVSVTQIVLRGLGRNIGWTAQRIAAMYDAIQQLSEEHNLHSFKVLSSLHPSRKSPFLWHENIQVDDKRRMVIWKMLTETTARLLVRGILVLDEQHIPLSDVLRDMDALPELESLESLHEISES